MRTCMDLVADSDCAVANPRTIRSLTTRATPPIAIDSAQLASWLAAQIICLIGISCVSLTTHNISAIATDPIVSAARYSPSAMSASMASVDRMTHLCNVVEKVWGYMSKQRQQLLVMTGVALGGLKANKKELTSWEMLIWEVADNRTGGTIKKIQRLRPRLIYNLQFLPSSSSVSADKYFSTSGYINLQHANQSGTKPNQTKPK